MKTYQVRGQVETLPDPNRAGTDFRVERIPESLEFEPGVLEFLESYNLLPGARGSVVGAGPDGTMTVFVDGSTVGVGPFTCDRMLVTTA